MKQLIGISGVATSGKDTFFKISQKLLQAKTECKRHSLAHALKTEVDTLCREQLGFSAFTEDPSQKELIRNLLVSWGQLRRQQNTSYWVNVIKGNFIEGVNFITDVRFKDEVDFIKKNGGKLLFLYRKKGNYLITPANDVEQKFTLPLQSVADVTLTWDSVGSDLHLLEDQVHTTLNKLLN